MLWIEEKYLKLISPRLVGFKPKRRNEWNCKCPLCGDSKKKAKQRGYFYNKMGKLMFFCHNCNASMLFSTFLKDFDPNLYKQYNMEMFKEKMLSNVKIIEKHIPETRKYIPNIFEDLPLVKNLDDKNVGRLFCMNRKLPFETFDFYYAENFIEWTLGNTDKFSEWKGLDHSRIVIPWYDRDSKIIGYSARALDNLQEQKYYRIFVDDSVKERYFGINRLDESKQIFVLEGEIDSLMIPNAIAVSNGKLHSYINKSAIYIPDADRRNKHICKNISNMIDLGLKVCLLPENLPGKDLNELVKDAGFTSDKLLDTIYKNTFSGIEARLKFNNWKVI